MEIGPHTSQARRVIVVLSPNSLANDWTDANVTSALKQLSTIKSQVIAVLLHDLSTISNFAKSTSDCLNISYTGNRVVLERVTILRWDIKSDKDFGGYKFWCRLRLVMPPMRLISLSADKRCQGVGMIMQTGNNNSTPQKTHSQESLEVLV